MSIIKKAIIPVAGAGTRFLPATKAQPKEMLPIIDKPVVQYIVEEAVASGIEDIILVTGPSKISIENHFDYNYELQNFLKKQGKEKDAAAVKNIADMANFIYVRQKGPYGNGTPVLNCRHIIGDEPFAVIWGDDLFVGEGKPRLKQLMEAYEKYANPILSCIEVDDEGANKYGIIDGVETEADIIQVKNIVEKPGPKKAPSRWGSIGAYILTPDIFPLLAKTKLGKDGELWLVDAIFALSKKRPLYAKKIKGKFYDTGSKFGWLKANIDFALQRDDLKGELKKYLKNLK
ncbi:UTP--glucose-1-phosphate uridylyltransferase [Candidatus Falkowbacteria bacterium CG10_big_fil_rev_8_21_14_0_10_43_11]|uniref:UTP--glucose-1-phosphate uridylyltransferase n=1 Tax=Candidatus Falkowbacteria bacterium CG10_big_fil_rev_8_21_14_0_10_43_11 TaxID=1974568 RepID=A0A2M6WLM9_9BACT|nr:MAG: UTP--glucose-1-phosphate uridylyltransferase [Candidatus Falkowbacteria bacterium CG10_big_fil_rev_8_21_14_0_10_43_11]